MKAQELCRAYNDEGEIVAVVMKDETGKVTLFGDWDAGNKALEASGYANMATAGGEDGSARSSKPFGG